MKKHYQMGLVLFLISTISVGRLFAQSTAPAFLEIGETYITTIGSLVPIRFVVTDLGKNGWIKVHLIDSDKKEHKQETWFNTSAALIIEAVPKTEKTLAQCTSNLKQIGLGVRMWASDHQNRVPINYASMEQDINSPKVLICPDDSARQKFLTSDWSQFSEDKSSYVIVDPDTLSKLEIKIDPEMKNYVYAQCPIHRIGVTLLGTIVKTTAP